MYLIGEGTGAEMKEGGAMEWNMDELIRQSLQQAARETKLSDEQKVQMLLNVLTKFLGSQIKDKDGTVWT